MPAELISPAEAHHRKTSLGWSHLDVRTALEFSLGRAPYSVCVPLYDFHYGVFLWKSGAFISAVKEKFPLDTKLVVSCRTGHRSAAAAAALAEHGYEHVADVRGGFLEWCKDKDLPVEK